MSISVALHFGEREHCITVYSELCSVNLGDFLPPTCRLFKHRWLLWTAARFLCTHFPKRRWQAESESLQVCGHDGGVSRRQLEQEVCWHESWQPAFCRDTNLWNGKSNLYFLKWTGATSSKTMSVLDYLAEQISAGWAWQNSLVHSGWQVSGSKESITAQAQMVHKDVNRASLFRVNAQFKSSAAQRPEMWISNLVLRLIVYQQRCQLL